MITVYKTSDEVELNFGEVSIWISPLTFEQKAKIQATANLSGGASVEDQLKASYLAIKYAVKRCSGIQYSDGSDYKLVLENGMLTDECADNIYNTELSNSLANYCVNLINGIPNHVTLPNGDIDETVKVVLPKRKKKG